MFNQFFKIHHHNEIFGIDVAGIPRASFISNQIYFPLQELIKGGYFPK